MLRQRTKGKRLSKPAVSLGQVSSGESHLPSFEQRKSQAL